MATIRKRTWTTKAGEKRSAWVLSYVDREGRQHRPQFPTKRDADDERIRIEGELVQGVHVPDRASATVHDVAKAFLKDFATLVKAKKRERSTLRAYSQHVDLHLAPFAVARTKVSRLSGPDCAAYARELEATRSDAMARRVFATFREIMKFGVTIGVCARNPAAEILVRTAGERAMGGDDDDDGRVEIPPKAQLRALLLAAETFDDAGEALAMVHALMFGGLRASELRGLRLKDIDLTAATLQVRQRADRWNQIGAVKTRRARRSIPLPPSSVKALKRWKLKAAKGERGLAFPTGAGTVEGYGNIYTRIWVPLLHWAGLTTRDDGKLRPLFGLHALRHVACSLWIEQGATPKQVQTWAGHASIQFTMDRYGHLWTDLASDQAIASAAEKSIIG
jgi:integrase